MKPLIWLLARTLVNLAKEAIRKPIVLIGYLFILGFVGFMIYDVTVMPRIGVANGTPQQYHALMTAIFAVFAWFSLRMGVDKGSSYFRQADVQFLFTGPFRPGTLLAYGFIKNAAGTLLMVFLGMCQLPNLRNTFELRPEGPAIVIFAILVFCMVYPTCGILLYSWASRNRKRRRMAKLATDAVAILGAIALLALSAATGDFLRAAVLLLDNPVVDWIPVLGWMHLITAAAVDGIGPAFFAGLGGMIALAIGSLIWLYRMNLDYYEDVLEATDYMEAALAAKRQGRNLHFARKVRSSVRGSIGGGGASAIFSKNLLEMRKTSLFLFIDRTSVIVVLAALAFRMFIGAELESVGLFPVLAFSIYILFLFSAQGKWSVELDRPFLFLIPAGAGEKMFYSTLADNLKNAMDGVILFTTAALLFHASPVQAIVCTAAYTMFGAVFVYGEILSRRMFGKIHSRPMQVFVKMIFTLFIMLPGIVAAVAAGVITENEVAMTAAMGAWAFVAASTAYVFSIGAFAHLESTV